MPFEEQVHRTFDFIKAALAVADCTLDDVVSSECWLTDPRDFVAFNAHLQDLFRQGSAGPVDLPDALHVQLQGRNES